MEGLTNEQKELAKGVFADDKKARAYYVNDSNTFINEAQYDALKKEDQKKYTEILNPDVKADKASDASSEKVLELEAEIDRLNGLKSVAAVKEAEAKLAEALKANETLAVDLAAAQAELKKLKEAPPVLTPQ